MSTNLFNPADKRKYPTRWPLYRGKQLFKVIDNRSEDEGKELLSVSHITGITPRSQKNVTMFQSESLIGYKLCEIGDIAANTMWTWQGAIGVSKYNGVVSPSYNVYRQKNNIYNPLYLDMLLRERKLIDVYHSLSTGIRASRLRLYPDVFLSISFPVPPRAEQDQIVRFLDWKASEINKLINIEKQKLTILREMLDSKFQDISLSSEEKISLKRLVSLDNEFVDIDSSAFYQKAGMYNRGRGIFLREAVLGSDMGDSLFQVIHANRLMISGQFAWEDAVYVTAKKDEAGLASHRYYLLKSINSNVPVEYLFGYFLSLKGLSDLQRCSHGAAGRNRPLNINELLRIKIPVINERAKVLSFSKIVQAYMEMRPIVLAKEQLFNELKNTIISDVVTGKIDVRNVTIPEYEHIDDAADAAGGEESAEELADAEEMEA